MIREEHLEGTENLAVDNEAAASEALFLLRRAGCQRLAVVSSEADTPSLVARHSAFTAAARASGVNATLVRVGPTNYSSGVEAARRLFSRSNSPDGVFCVTDLLALGFMDAARNEFGLDVPRDLCVVGFDDIEQANWESYRLTTFRQPAAEMVDHIAALLSSDGAVAERRVFAASPVWRKTVRPNAA
jgi:DNA-binding LacI/PurR family transcriptional regulator